MNALQFARSELGHGRTITKDVWAAASALCTRPLTDQAIRLRAPALTPRDPAVTATAFAVRAQLVGAA